MLRNLPRDVAVGLKDQLREVRHMIRSGRHDRSDPGAASLPRAPTPEIERLMSRAASVIDDTLTMAETVSQSVLPLRHRRGAQLHGYDLYFSTDEGERAFRHDLYAVFKALNSAGNPNPRPIAEARLAIAHKEVGQAAAASIASLSTDTPDTRLAAIANIAAVSAVQLVKSGAVNLSDHDGRDLRQLATVALAIGLATFNHREVSDRELLESSALAAKSRQDRITAAWAAPDQAGELAAVFRPLLAVLP
ncbi:MAG: hypothetical protein WBF87_18250 [Mesorhizobium sp.]